MAKEIPNLVAEARTGTGKGAARQARRDGKVPGIVYGDHKDPIAIQFDFNKLLTTLRAGRFMSTLWNLQVPGQEDVRVICRGVQKDVVKDLPTHIDLMRLRRTTKVNLFIHVDFVNAEASPGLKRGKVQRLALKITKRMENMTQFVGATEDEVYEMGLRILGIMPDPTARDAVRNIEAAA